MISPVAYNTYVIEYANLYISRTLFPSSLCLIPSRSVFLSRFQLDPLQTAQTKRNTEENKKIAYYYYED